MKTTCYCGHPLSPGLELTGIDAHHCPACGYWRTTYRTGGDRVGLQSGGHPSTFQGQDGRRFGSVIGTIRALSARYRARRAQLHTDARESPRIIDFGCGQGYFLDALRDTGHHGTGIEISEITARQAIAKGHDVSHSLAALDPSPFDAVASVHVLEHIPDPVASLDCLRPHLKPGARIYFEVPNFDSLQARWFRERWLHCEPGLHVHHFTTASFAGLLRQCGIEIETVETYSFEHGLLGWVQSLLNQIFPYNRFLYNVVLNQPLAAKLRCWPELLLMPLLIPVGALLLVAEAALGRGAVLRVRGRVALSDAPAPVQTRPADKS